MPESPAESANPEPSRSPVRRAGRRLRKDPEALKPLRTVISESAEPTLFRVVWILNEILKRVTRRDWRGQENIPAEGGAVLVLNHISNIDPLAFGQYVSYAGRWPRYLGKASLFKIPIIGRIITACGQIPVERDTHNAGVALEQAMQAIRDGKCVSIYPEGTITFDPDLWPMRGRSGAALIALSTGCPVIPIGQWGAQDVMYGKKVHVPKLFPRKTLILKAGPPVDLDDLRDQRITSAVLNEATDRMMAAITSLVAELRQAEAPAVRFDPRKATKEKGDDA